MEVEGKRKGSTRSKQIVAVALAVTFCAVLDLAAAQLRNAIAAARPWRTADKLYRIESAEYHHDLRPLVHVENVAFGPTRYEVFTNSLGFKDSSIREVPLVPNRYRILFLGDSFTEGIGYGYDQTFVGLVGKDLSNRGIEVLNGGVVSYSPSIYFAKAKHWLNKGFRCDEIVVFIDLSDIGDEANLYDLTEDDTVRARPGMVPDAAFAGTERRDEARPSLREFVRGNTIIPAWIARTVKDALWGETLPISMTDPLRGAWTYDSEAYERWGHRGMELATASMDRLADLARSYSIKLTIAVYPWPNQIVRGELDSLQVRHWRAWAHDREIPFLDLFPAFINGQDHRKVVLDNFVYRDFHWNEGGHQRVAAAFLKFYDSQ